MRPALWLIPSTLASLLALGAVSPAPAQTYPERAVRMIVPFPAGATMDFVVRLVSQKLSEDWGKQVYVENRTGGAGLVGTNAGAKSDPDGYTMLAVANSFAGNPALRDDLPYDTEKDFEPVSLLGSTPHVLVAHPSVPANTVQELVALAKKQPGKISYAGAIGASPHLAGEMLKSRAGINLLFVPYRGQAPAQTDLLAGVVHLAFGNLPDVMPLVRDGKLKALAIATLKRSQLAPEIPTLVEAGFPEFESDSWYGILAPAKTPKDIIAKQHAGIAKALSLPDVKQRLDALGLEPVGSTPEEFRAFLKNKMTSYAKIIKEANIRMSN